MFSEGFDIIARERPDIGRQLDAIKAVLLAAGPNPVLQPDVIAELAAVPRPVTEYVLNRLIELQSLRTEERLLCADCGQVVSDDVDICENCGLDLGVRQPRKETFMTFDGKASLSEDFWENAAESVVVGVITALPKEAAAVLKIFDDVGLVSRASAAYDIGLIRGIGGTHRVVHTTSPNIGNTAAGVVGTKLIERFPMVRYLILVGIAGVVPNPVDPLKHARLGDVFVSDIKGVVEYDYRKEQDGWEEIRAAPTRPDHNLLDAVNRLRRSEYDGTPAADLPWVAPILPLCTALNVAKPEESMDVLHSAEDVTVVLKHPPDPTRTLGVPRVHYCPIASSGTLLKNPKRRDQLGVQFGVKAVEMEGAGIAEAAWAGGRGYLVIRGGCDYCDTHKNDAWHGYAAVVAAAYLKALLLRLPVT